MKVCFYGLCGHSFIAFSAHEKLPQVIFAACCPCFQGEDIRQYHQMARDAGASMKEYQNLEDMLNAEKPDILVVDNRFAEHGSAAGEALKRGINVFVDKPVTTDGEELMSLYKLAKQNGTLLWAMNTVRYDPWYYTARLLIEQGEIGRVRMVNCRKSYKLNTRPPFYKERRYYGGTIPWVTIHAIDMIRMTAKCDGVSVYSMQSRAENCGYGDMEMTTASCFQMENDILATISTDYCRPSTAHSHDDDQLRVVGTDGIVEVARRDGDHEVRLLNAGQNGAVPVFQQSPPLIFEDFVHTIEGHGIGLLDMQESFKNAYHAIAAQQSADLCRPVSLKNVREMFT